MMSSNNLVPVVMFVGIFAIPIVGIIGHYCHLIFKEWQEVGLKRDMVARGYTAQEIIEVIAARQGGELKSSLPNVPPAKPVKQPVYSP